jgi:type II secretory pathway pseudopilin PulG
MRSGDAQTRPAGRQRGFAYLLVLFVLAGMGLLLAGAGEVWHAAAQRDKEAELLFIGNQFRRALASYRLSTPAGGNPYPATLEDLVEDRRFPMPRRHLRRLYKDPLDSTRAWGVVKANDRIVAVHSTLHVAALRTAFQRRDAAFTGRLHYDEWVFGDDSGGAAR